MSKDVKIVVIVVIAFLLLLIVAFWFVFKGTNIDMKPLIKTEEVTFNDIDETVYLRAMSWGIAGNHNEIIISTSPISPIDRKSEKEMDFIFYTTEVYYKKQGVDTILIYAESSSIGKEPPNYQGRVKVVIKRLKTYDDSKEYEKNYEQYGLKKISTY